MNYVEKAKKEIDTQVDLEIWNLKRYAEKENLEFDWVLETFRDKFNYKIKQELDNIK